MSELVHAVLNNSEEKVALRQLLGEWRSTGKKYFLHNEILQTFEDYCQQGQKPPYFFHSSAVGQLLHYTHEILLEGESIWFLLRPKVASQEACRLSADLSSVEPMGASHLLELRDRLANRYQPQLLEIDFSPFYQEMPIIRDPRDIGRGWEVLNRYLCSKLLTEPQYWWSAVFKAMHQQRYDGLPLLINDRIDSGAQLSQKVKKASEFVAQFPGNEPYENFRFQLQELGFEPGWGNTASRVRETLELLNRLLDAPDPPVLEAFVSRIPGIFRAVFVAVHGWVAQEDVLGRSETAAKVVYVLNQARSLEKQLRENLHLAGLDLLGIQPQVLILTRLIPNCEGTQCNQRLEKVQGTENAWILRVPFPDCHPHLTQNWISKFESWPYLEDFALAAERELVAQLQGKPDLIIGNYSDGNLVAFLLARRFHAIQGYIAHALEKSRYLFSDLYWQDMEGQYHFSVQFTADLIAMNGADFIIASSYQEIVGTPDSLGQYESYKCFTMPQLYHVVDGIELFSPKFNVVPPGIDENIFFPYSQAENRVESDTARLRNLLLYQENPAIWGRLENPDKRPIFAIGPINAIKNLTGLVECFGQSKSWQEHCNLILLLGKLHPAEATNPEEKQEIERLHELLADYGLYGSVRWLGKRLTSLDLGEAYRVIADLGGIFVQFSRFEAFGISLLEAALSGLPSFATQFGGSLEIIRDGENGFLINPTEPAETAQKIVEFVERCEANPQVWQDISQRAIASVREKYSWQRNAQKLLLLAKIYGFWKNTSQEKKEALHRYLEALFHLIYKPRAAKILDS